MKRIYSNVNFEVYEGETKLLFELLVSWSSRKSCRFLVMIVLGSILVGWFMYVNTRGL